MIKKVILLLNILLAFALLELSTTTAQVLEQDSLALVAFYNSTGGPNWTHNNHWLTGPVSTWYGVTVEGGRVVELSLYLNNLNGTIPLEIGNLTQIKKFKLGHDKGLSGEIPESVINLSQLEVFVICNCSIYGTITNKICNCSNLSSLQLWENNLTGPIPIEIGNLNSLRFLDLHDNQLSGTIPLELGNCTNLLELWLNNNFLTGALPTELANLSEVYYFDVSFNQLEGDIPDELAKVISYMDLFFNDNNFTGIPPWDNNWFLNALGLQNNKMTFEDIEPHFVGYMWFNYAPQDSMGVKIDTTLTPGSNFKIYSGTGGEYTEYFWYKNGELILQSTEADTLFLTGVSYADTGTYTCWAENSLAVDLILKRRHVHISVDTGTNIINYQTQKDILVFPNPVNEKINIRVPFSADYVILQISNIQGIAVLTQKYKPYNNSTVVLDIKELKQGIYFLQVQTEGKNYKTKFLKNNRGRDI